MPQEPEPVPEPIPEPAIAHQFEPVPEGAARAIAALTSLMCRWPEGDPLSDEFAFCGELRSAESTSSYCPIHHALSVGRGTPSERKACDLRAFRRTSGLLV